MFFRFLVSALCLLVLSSKAVTIRTMVHGDWENPACWSGGQVPANPDTILVRHYMVIHQNLTINSPSVLFIENTGTICGDYILETSCGAGFINYGHMYLNQIKTRLGTNYNVIECKNNITLVGCPSPTAGFHSVPPNGSVKVWPPVLCKMPDTNWEGGTSIGMAEWENDDLRLYPNPVGYETLTITSERGARIRLTDAVGKELETKTFERKAEIDFREWPAGVYFLELETGGKKTVRKIIRY